MIPRLLLAFLAALAIVSAACGDDDAPDVADECEPGGLGGPGCSPSPTGLPTVTVAFNDGGTLLQVEIADDPGERSVGLMNRESMPEDHGMLFTWPSDSTSGFWMHNTLIPLSIAFIAADGTVLHIEDMAPQTDDLHHSPQPYRYAIEANQGWYEEHGVEVGEKAEIPPLGT
jgi:uncharacterized membrane protein (UPF0127 family)